MPHILLVDDEASIRTVVTAYLKEAGFEVYTAVDGRQGLELFRRHHPQLVILDVMLPSIDGLEVLQAIRRESDVYVLMLTAKSEEMDRVIGLTVGADDYLTKPFSPRELVARIKAILRRERNSAAREVYVFARVRLDTRQALTWRDDALLDLTPLEFKLLQALVTNSRIVLSREQLLQDVWGYDFYGDTRVVDVHIRHLRQKLEPNPANPQFIQTVRGIGYRFEDEPL